MNYINNKLSILVFLFGILLCSCSNSASKNNDSSSHGEEASLEIVANEAIPKDSLNRPTVIDFGADWCVWCKKLEPIIMQLSKKYEKKVLFKKVDTDIDPQFAKEYNISGLPTLIFLDSEGVEISRIEGFTDAETIEKSIEKVIHK